MVSGSIFIDGGSAGIIARVVGDAIGVTNALDGGASPTISPNVSPIHGSSTIGGTSSTDPYPPIPRSAEPDDLATRPTAAATLLSDGEAGTGEPIIFATEARAAGILLGSSGGGFCGTIVGRTLSCVIDD